MVKRRIACCVGLGLALIFLGMGLRSNAPDKYIRSYGEGKMYEYVGGDAYNFIIEASLRGGEISGAMTARAVYFSASAVLLLLSLLGLSRPEEQPRVGRHARKEREDDGAAEAAAMPSAPLPAAEPIAPAGKPTMPAVEPVPAPAVNPVPAPVAEPAPASAVEPPSAPVVQSAPAPEPPVPAMAREPVSRPVPEDVPGDDAPLSRRARRARQAQDGQPPEA